MLEPFKSDEETRKRKEDEHYRKYMSDSPDLSQEKKDALRDEINRLKREIIELSLRPRLAVGELYLDLGRIEGWPYEPVVIEAAHMPFRTIEMEKRLRQQQREENRLKERFGLSEDGLLNYLSETPLPPSLPKGLPGEKEPPYKRPALSDAEKPIGFANVETLIDMLLPEQLRAGGIVVINTRPTGGSAVNHEDGAYMVFAAYLPKDRLERVKAISTKS